MSADEGSEVPYDSREEEREHDRVQVFPQGEFVLLELVDEYEEETERSSRKGKVIVGSDEKPQKSFGNDVFEFGKVEEQPREHERGQEELEGVPDEKIRVDSEFSGKLVEHSEEKEERDREGDSESVDGYPEGEFDLRVHAGF